ncbi:MAG: alpha/beta hydrolase [Pyrinomonadaceae bacterium]
MKKRNIGLAIGGAIGAAVAVKMLTRAGSVPWADVVDSVAHSDRSRHIDVDGRSVHYQEFGSKSDPVLVLIHGYTASTYVWKTTAPMLADAGYRVIALDLIGFGFSDKPRAFDYSIHAQAEMISGFLDRLEIDRATLVGSSYGGAVAMTVAITQPDRVNELVLVDPVTNDGPKRHPILRLAAIRGVGEIITPLIADSRFFMRHRMRGTLHKSSHHLITRDRMNAIRRPLASSEGHHSLLATSRKWSAAHIMRDADRIKVPTLIIWGENDRVIPVKNGYTLHEKMPNSRLVVLKDCGHVPPEEKTEVFVDLVSKFCKVS